MARKPTAIVQFSLRIREGLRRRLETASKKRGVSTNYEITSRLERSLDEESLFTLYNIASDMDIAWARGWGGAIGELNKQGDLIRAAETLIAQVGQLSDIPGHQEVKKAAEGVERVIEMIDRAAGRLIRQAHTLGGDK